jgi:hypothetical protein
MRITISTLTGLILSAAFAAPATACKNHGFYGGGRFSAFSAMEEAMPQRTTFEDNVVPVEQPREAIAKVPDTQPEPATIATVAVTEKSNPVDSKTNLVRAIPATQSASLSTAR